MSDLQPQFVLSTAGAGTAGTVFLTVPVDGDLVAVTSGLSAAGSTASTTDVQVNGVSVFATAANVAVSGDAGASIAASKLQTAGDSASKVAKATAASAVRAGMTNQVTNNVTSGIDFWTPAAPADAVLKACKAGDEVSIITTVGTGATRNNVALHFVRK